MKRFVTLVFKSVHKHTNKLYYYNAYDIFELV